MPARKTKKTAVKKTVSRSRKTNAGLKPVHLVMIGIGAAVVVAGYLFFQNNIQSPTSPTNELKTTVDVNGSNFKNEVKDQNDTASGEEKNGKITLVEQNDSNESGVASVTEVDGKAVVAVTVYGSDTSSHTASIHSGSCQYSGADVYELANLIDGTSKTTLEISKQQLMWQVPLSIAVHRSATDDEVVACGDISY